jgi:iron complex transport system substrate-binding protein
MAIKTVRQAIWLAGLAAVAALLLHGCKDKPAPSPSAARPRIVTYSPALTQMVVDLGLGANLVGVTSQCTVPPELHPAIVGDAFHVGVEAILSARPDVILVQMNAERFNAVRSVEPNIVVEHFTIERIADIPPAIERIGRIAGREDLSRDALAKWRTDLEAAGKIAASGPAASGGARRPRVLFVLGYRGPSTGGEGTFLADMIEQAGGDNVAADLKGWAQVGLEYAINAKPDVLVCLLDSQTQSAAAAREYWQPVLGSGPKAARMVVLTDRKWTIPGLHTAGCVRKLAEILHGGGQGDAP